MGDVEMTNTPFRGQFYRTFTSVAIVLESENNSTPVKVVLN